MAEIIGQMDVPGYRSGARVFHRPIPAEKRPRIGNINGMSVGEMIYRVPRDKAVGFARMEILQERAKYQDIEKQRDLTIEESRDLLLLEAEETALEVEIWREEHPKFVAAVHEWVDKGYADAIENGQPMSRLEVVQAIVSEFYEDAGNSDIEEPSELLETMRLIEQQYMAEESVEAAEKRVRDSAVKVGGRTLELAA